MLVIVNQTKDCTRPEGCAERGAVPDIPSDLARDGPTRLGQAVAATSPRTPRRSAPGVANVARRRRYVEEEPTET
ncbi:unnamed protein product [Lota lota]